MAICCSYDPKRKTMVCPAVTDPCSSYPVKAQGCAVPHMQHGCPAHVVPRISLGMNRIGGSPCLARPITSPACPCLHLQVKQHVCVTTLFFGTWDEKQSWFLLIKSCKSSKDQCVGDRTNGWDLCRVPSPDRRSS